MTFDEALPVIFMALMGVSMLAYVVLDGYDLGVGMLLPRAGDADKDTIALCRIGERSSLTWFVLTELLGRKNVKNYDGSWTEYGSLVGVPVAIGDEPGEA